MAVSSFMNSRLAYRAIVLGATICMMVFAPACAWAGKRVALVIGNSAYHNVLQLPNPARDAQAVAKMFKDAGFDSVDLQLNVGNLDFKRTIRRFEATAEKADIAVIYYAGHGLEIGGTNFLIPVDARLANGHDADDEAIPLARLVASANEAKTLRLVILDACCENPLVRTMERDSKASIRALNAVLGFGTPTPTGTLIAFAAKAGSRGSHGLFTAAILKNLTVPGLDIRLALGRVRNEVMKETGNQQEPFINGSLGGASVSLVPGPAVAEEAADKAETFKVVVSGGAHAQTPPSSPRQEQPLVSSNNAFACDLYAELKTTEGNLFFSPFSVSTALAMTLAGAKAATADQMRKTLRLPTHDADAGFAALLKHFSEVNDSGRVQLNMANSIWPQAGYPILEGFRSLLRQRYEVEITAVDYQHAEQKARAAINRWVEDKTQDKIRNLLAGPLDPDTRLVLVNAVYFKAAWQHPFDPRLTETAPFYPGNHRVVQAPLMHKTTWSNYAELDHSQIIELPYKSAALSMFVVLPKDNSPAGIANLEKELTPASIAAWKAQMKAMRVNLSLPKFRFEWGTASLKQPLKNLGMRDALVLGKADFSGINGDKSFFIGDVLHKAFVAVDESGTEAGAATEVPFLAIARVFRADHPFVFFIQDNASGSILFMGRMTNPPS